MKTIERQIRNHEFEIRLEPTSEPVKYLIDGLDVHRDDFRTAIALLSAEVPK